MRQGRTFLLLGLLLVIFAGAAVLAVVFLPNLLGQGGTPGAETPEAIVTATPEPIVSIIGAAQKLERGAVIPTEALIALPWPTALVPPSAITDVTKIVDTRARYTIERGEPILTTMIVQSLSQLSPFGSDAAAQIPPGAVAISIPYDRRNGVAMGIEDGDHVNVIVSWALVNIDPSFQSALPNLAVAVAPELRLTDISADGGIPGTLYDVAAPVLHPQANPTPLPFGRGERGVVIPADFYVIPSEPQRPRLVSQSIIQDVLVLRVGNFVEVVPTKPPEATPTADPNNPQQTNQNAPAPTSTPAPPDLITLIVSPQDALALNYINRMLEQYPGSVQITLVLRSAGDPSLMDTESVTMSYMFERYNITVPTPLDYGIYSRPLPTAVLLPTPTAGAPVVP